MDKTSSILLVDDDPAILRVYSEILRAEGYEVWEASTGQQGLQEVRERRPDLVLLDVMLPDLSGLEVCRQIKADAALDDVFVVLVSGRATSVAHKVDGLGTGADDYLVKSLDIAEFLARVRTIVRLRNTTAALRASEQRYRELVEIMPDAVFRVDSQGRLLTVNAQAVAMFGYSSPAELLQKSAFDLTRPEEHARMRADIATVLKTGSVREVEYLCVGKDGHLLPAELRSSVARDGNGHAVGLVVVVRDITERKRAEAALRDHEQLGQMILGTAMDGFWMVSFEGKLLQVNEAYCRMSGYSREELLSLQISDLEMNEPSQAEVAQHMQRIARAGKDRFETRHRCKDGRVMDVEVSVNCLELRKRCFFAFLRDITDRKRAEEKLAMLAHAVESTTEMICITDLEDRFLFVNRAFQETYGYTEAEILKSTPHKVFSPRNPPSLLSEILQQTRLGGWRGEVLDVRKDGTELLISLSTSQVKDPSGQVLGLMGVAQDITEHKRVEEQARLLADAVQSTQELICITNEENRFTFANQAFLQTHGYLAEELMGRTPDFLYSARNPPGLCDVVFRQTLHGGWKGEIRNRRKDGTEFPISLSTSQIKNGEGRTIGLIGVSRDISERKRAEKRTAAFSQLGHRLSTAIVPHQAAQIIMDIARELFGWDAGYVHLYSEGDDRLIPVLTFDTVDGQQTLVEPTSFTLDPSPLMRLVMNEGAQLINRDNKTPLSLPLVPFGHTIRRSASMMYVPIRSGGTVIGILSVQSYTPRAYAQDDLRLLQSLADHCGDALRRIKAAESLREAEAKYRSIVENATEGIFQITPDGRFRTANPALAQMLGYKTPEELMTQVTDLERQSHARPEKRQEFKRLLETQDSVRAFEFEYYRKDGSIIWVSVSGRAVRDASGMLQYYEGTIRDLTERRSVENLLRRQRDFGIFLSSTDDLEAAAKRLLNVALQNEGLDCGAVYLVNPQTNALDLTAHQGLSAGFSKRSSHFAVDPVPNRSADVRQAASRKQPGPMAGIVCQLKREGLLALEVIPIQHVGEVVAVLNVGSRSHATIPATTRQAIEALAAQAGGAIMRIRAERSMRRSRQLLEKTIYNLQSAVFIVDADLATIQECNPAATRMFGRSREEMIGQSPSLLYLSEAKREEFKRHLQAAVKERGVLSEFEFEMRRRDGTSFPSEATVVPIRNEEGQIVSWVGVFRDITKPKVREAGLRQLSRRILEAQEAERQRVGRELHDSVNQLIASAKMRLRRVSESALLNPAARELLARCGELLVQALDENRRIAHDLRPADLDALGLAEACRNFCRQFQARTNLVVSTRLARFAQRCPPSTELNLFRIMQEALNNVEKHARARTVRLQIAVQQGSLMLKIQDDGLGFDPNAIKVTRRKGEGFGLANIRERAAILGGNCEVESTPNQGTTITVRVPCQAP